MSVPMHLLVVDDEPAVERLIRMTLRAELREEVYTITFAQDGVDALEKLDAHPDIGVVLTDLNMPRMDGLTLLGHLRNKPVRVVVVSAYGDMSNIRAAMNRGAYDFVTKPIDRADLKATIEKTCQEVDLDRETAQVRKQLATTQQALDVASQVQAAKAQFFADLSHEIRTPLTLILGPLDDASRTSTDSPESIASLQVAVMRRNAHRLKRLVDQFLDLSKIESGRLILRATPHPLGAFVHEVVQAFQPGAERKNIQLQTHFPPEDVVVYFEPDKIEKVVANLVSNALKFTPEGGRVLVRVSQQDGQALLSVRDNGIGIPVVAQPNLFDRFYQVAERLTEAKGTGIGLALSKALVEAHYGMIGVESESGFGATFTVQLPLGTEHLRQDEFVDEAPSLEHSAVPGLLSDEEVSPDERDVSEDLPNAEERPVVVVIEDHVDVRHYITQHLQTQYRVVQATNGEEGLDTVRRERPALVVCDVRMPRMGGMDVCRTIKQDEQLASIPVVLLTSQIDEASRLEGFAAGADAYLPKPFNARELLLRAENLIDVRRRLQKRYSETASLEGTTITVESADAAWLVRVRDAIEANMHRSSFKIGDAADEVGVSPRHLRRRLRELTGLSPSAYVRMLRMDRASQLLAQKAGSVSEIAYQVGYLDAKYFSQQFRQVFGVLPSAFDG